MIILPAKGAVRKVLPAERAAPPVLETSAHESSADEEDGNTRHDRGEYLAQSLREIYSIVVKQAPWQRRSFVSALVSREARPALRANINVSFRILCRGYANPRQTQRHPRDNEHE